VPRRGVGPKKLTEIKQFAAESHLSTLPFLLQLTAEELMRFGPPIADFAKTINYLAEKSKITTVAVLIDEVLETTGYKQYLNDGSTENEARLENIKELLTVARKFDNSDSQNGLENFLNEVALIEEETTKGEGTDGSVTLMTIHAAKGLEFGHVFVAGMEEGIFPHSRSYLDPNELEEERRLAYVAVTRAKQNLYLTFTESRNYFGNISSNPVSRFVGDIPNSLLEYAERLSGDYISNGETTSQNQSGLKTGIKSWGDSNKKDGDEKSGGNFKKGDLVKHAIFGVGEVEDLDDALIIIQFPSGKKELALEYVKLEKV
jgi:DNA helicase-2/ATP-dependent DNA helicase PcrA